MLFRLMVIVPVMLLNIEPLFWLVAIINLVLSPAIAIRRLQDTNTSGLLFLLNFIGLGFLLLLFYCSAGTADGEFNRYGERHS